jgi:hypothetical protein
MAGGSSIGSKAPSRSSLSNEDLSCGEASVEIPRFNQILVKSNLHYPKCQGKRSRKGLCTENVLCLQQEVEYMKNSPESLTKCLKNSQIFLTFSNSELRLSLISRAEKYANHQVTTAQAVWGRCLGRQFSK